jgi:hypothetical protein
VLFRSQQRLYQMRSQLCQHACMSLLVGRHDTYGKTMQIGQACWLTACVGSKIAAPKSIVI